MLDATVNRRSGQSQNEERTPPPVRSRTDTRSQRLSKQSEKIQSKRRSFFLSFYSLISSCSKHIRSNNSFCSLNLKLMFVFMSKSRRLLRYGSTRSACSSIDPLSKKKVSFRPSNIHKEHQQRRHRMWSIVITTENSRGEPIYKLFGTA